MIGTLEACVPRWQNLGAHLQLITVWKIAVL